MNKKDLSQKLILRAEIFTYSSPRSIFLHKKNKIRIIFCTIQF